MGSARSVLISADQLLRQGSPLDRDIDAVLATSSIGGPTPATHARVVKTVARRYRQLTANGNWYEVL
jgi:hypothetical protein